MDIIQDPDDDALIDHCARQSKQLKPLFAGYHVRRMYELANEPPPEPLHDDKFYQLTFTMERLVKRARSNRRRHRIHLVHIQD